MHALLLLHCDLRQRDLQCARASPLGIGQAFGIIHGELDAQISCVNAWAQKIKHILDLRPRNSDSHPFSFSSSSFALFQTLYAQLNSWPGLIHRLFNISNALINMRLLWFLPWIRAVFGRVTLNSISSRTALEGSMTSSIPSNMSPQCVDTTRHPEWGRAVNPINTDWCRGAESKLLESVTENVGTVYTFYSQRNPPWSRRPPGGWQLPDGAKYSE